MNEVTWMFLIFLLNSLVAFGIGYALARHLHRRRGDDLQKQLRDERSLHASTRTLFDSYRKLDTITSATTPVVINPKPSMTTEQAESLFNHPGSLVAPGGWYAPKSQAYTPPEPGPDPIKVIMEENPDALRTERGGYKYPTSLHAGKRSKQNPSTGTVTDLTSGTIIGASLVTDTTYGHVSADPSPSTSSDCGGGGGGE